MSHFLPAFHNVIMLEGGYSNGPRDSGGKTRWGITERVARANGYDSDMSALSLETAQKIYKRQYWDAMSLDHVAEVSPGVAEKMFDAGVNVGTGRVSEWLQRALNALNSRGSLYADMSVDGAIGPVTIAALRAYLGRRDETVLMRAINSLQGAFYITLAERREKDETFLYGWLRTRID